MKDINLICFVTSLCVALLCSILLPILPILTRKSYLFGVKIPPEEQNCPEAKRLKKRYVTICLVGGAAVFALIIIQYVTFPDMSLIAAMYFPLFFVVVQFAAFIPNWKRAVELKESHGWKVSSSSFAETKSSHSRGDLSEVPWGWYVSSFMLIFASIVVALIKYPGLPDQIPTHFDANMQPDAWSDKSLLTVITMPLINLATAFLMFLLGTMFVKAKLQIDPQNPSLSFAQHRIYRKRMGHSIGFLTLGLTIGLALIGLKSIWPDLSIPFWLIIALLFIPPMCLIFVSILSGQGGCRIKPPIIAKESPMNTSDMSTLDNTFGRGDDRFWVLGMFYHNPDDPAYIVEDRFGSNLGFNYSRLTVKIGAGLLLLLLLAVYLWITALICSSV